MTARAGTTSLFVIVLCIGLFMGAQPAAQDAGPHFTISGTSTVRSWSCPARGMIEVTPGDSSEPVSGFPNGVQTLTVTVPVKAIECPEEGMIEHLRETLNEPAHPEIVYQLQNYTLTGDDTVTVKGTITVTGVTKPIEFDVTLAPSPQGMRTQGEATIDMTEFGVTPPNVWLGMLKVGKQVRVRFDAVLQPPR